MHFVGTVAVGQGRHHAELAVGFGVGLRLLIGGYQVHGICLCPTGEHEGGVQAGVHGNGLGDALLCRGRSRNGTDVGSLAVVGNSGEGTGPVGSATNASILN